MSVFNMNIKKQITLAWIIGLLILAASLGLEFIIHPHPNFEIDGALFFHAWYGFGACLVIIIVSKLLSFLKRPEDYYQQD